ncbi:AAA family ATPase [Micromonospora sp. NPDC000207]|uniref:helix-turn-helix transcriptional regulator n=1 Tax=Micromonospora sp. NPDC000207 TaxID=3154246 RepID=UPI00332B04DD
MELLGRDPELERISTLLGNGRDGRGGSLLLLGDPGIGKTTLLKAATGGLTGRQLLEVDGFEAEITMPFAAVQRLIRPLRRHLDAVPDGHRQALLVAAGEVAGPAPDRFLVGLGVLGLLGAAGGSTPVVCSVDDAHLLDAESLDVLAFVGRRLAAEPVTLLLAARTTAAFPSRAAGIATVALTGLPQEAARRLLTRSLPGPIDPLVAARVVAATDGNPLALVDLAAELTIQQLTESSFGDEPLPIGRHLEQHYLRQVCQLGEEVRLWLLVAAADSTGNLDLITLASQELGLPADVAEAAEAAGLVELGRALRFRHPLVRSAAYNAAEGRQRRRAHRALSAVAEKLDLVERAAWHAAKATLGVDEDVAQRLELVADLAARRGGFASRARVLIEASALTLPGRRRSARLVGAAEAALTAGVGQLTKDLVDEIDEDSLEPVSRGRLVAVRAAHSLFVAAPALTHAAADMLAAAAFFHGEDPDLEQAALIRAWECALPAERLNTGLDWTDLGRRLAEGARVKQGDAATILRAVSALILEPYAAAVPPVRAALAAYDRMGAAEILQFGHSCVALATAVWDVDAIHRFLTRWAEAARDVGALQMLDNALWVLSLTEATGGTPYRAVQYMEQVRELRRAIGYDAEHVVNVAVLAWSAAARDQVLAMAEATYRMGFGGVQASALAVLARIDLAEGRDAEAYATLKPFIDDPFLHVTATTWPDFAEAAARTGHLAEARAVVAKLDERAEACRTPLALGLAARSRAVVEAAASGVDVERHFRAAVTVLDGCRARVEEGRAHLAYGEWLRRTRRRAAARPHLRRAAEIFGSAGADAFTGRAGRELRALGDTWEEATPARPAGLTSQELTAAELAAAGHTNAEIGAAMFLSVNTVDYHLRKVFQKLGVSSRRQLADRLRRGQA